MKIRILAILNLIFLSSPALANFDVRAEFEAPLAFTKQIDQQARDTWNLILECENRDEALARESYRRGRYCKENSAAIKSGINLVRQNVNIFRSTIPQTPFVYDAMAIFGMGADCIGQLLDRSIVRTQAEQESLSKLCYEIKAIDTNTNHVLNLHQYLRAERSWMAFTGQFINANGQHPFFSQIVLEEVLSDFSPSTKPVWIAISTHEESTQTRMKVARVSLQIIGADLSGDAASCNSRYGLWPSEGAQAVLAFESYLKSVLSYSQRKFEIGQIPNLAICSTSNQEANPLAAWRNLRKLKETR